MSRNWGLERLNDAAYKKSILDMKQADLLIERILFLEGLPNLQRLAKLRIGETPAEMLACDTQFQLDQLPTLRDAIVDCETKRDFVSRKILVHILDGEELHLDWLETQQYLINNIGLENYLQSQVEED